MARVVLLVVLMIIQTQGVPPSSLGARLGAYRDGLEVTDADLALRPVALDDTHGWTARDLEAAAMLHTDIGLRMVKGGRRGEASQQFDAAAAFLKTAVGVEPTSVEYAGRWFDAVVALLEAYGASDLAKVLDTRRHEWWPESKDAAAAWKAFGQGLTHEIQAAVAGRLSGPPPARAFAIPPDALGLLRQAAADYIAARASDPANTQVALHLGRVFVLLGRDSEAGPELRAASASVNPAVRYLALMFSGAIEERAGRLDQAVEAYRSARDLFRWGQSAPLALSHALMRLGRDSEARETLTDHFDTTHGRVCEPLWTYLADPSTDLGPTLDELRAEIWR